MLGLGRSSTGGGEFEIQFVNGPIKFHSEEGVLYSRLFHIVGRHRCCVMSTSLV
jgi:hypothetical protein